jgi:hypothetical protein
MAVLWVIAAGVAALAFYKFGELQGAWKRWRSAVGVLRSRRSEAFSFFGGLALWLAVGALVLFIIFSLSGHH